MITTTTRGGSQTTKDLGAAQEVKSVMMAAFVCLDRACFQYLSPALNNNCGFRRAGGHHESARC
jgi:hypothetical protein